MRVAVVVPVRNAGHLIEPTLASMVQQTALFRNRAELHVVIQDGASEDDTIQRANDAIRSARNSPGISWHIVSEPDTGLYDAVAKGFAAIGDTADWYGYLNAGDFWAPTCVDTLIDVAEQTDTRWLCGLHGYFNASGTLVHTRLPFRYTAELLRAGAYGRGLPTVQQESTFWRRDLHVTVDWKRITGYRVAGDAFLWWSFAECTEPTVIQALLGGFSYHGAHLGGTKHDYRLEIEHFAGRLSPATRLRIATERPLWEQPTLLLARMNPGLLTYDITRNAWRSRTGAVVRQSLSNP